MQCGFSCISRTVLNFENKSAVTKLATVNFQTGQGVQIKRKTIRIPLNGYCHSFTNGTNTKPGKTSLWNSDADFFVST